MTLPPSAKLVNSDSPYVEIDHAAATAKIALQGAHIFSWTPRGHRELLYTSPTAQFRLGKAIRGGVPVCWPWFNAHPDDESLPSHGFARTSTFELVSGSEDADAVQLTFRLLSTDEMRKLYPHDFALELEISIGASLELRLKTTNVGDDDMPVGGALHSYLAVSDIEKVHLSGLDGIAYIDTVGAEKIERQKGDISINKEVDRIYIDTSDSVTLHDTTRTIQISKSGSSSTVIWNPWVEKAAALDDMPDDDFRNFVCVEAANARADTRQLCPDGIHVLAQTISIQSP